MSRTTRTLLMSGAALAVALCLAMGSVLAQDDAEPTEDMDSMDPMEQMEPGISVRDAWTRESMMVDLAGAAYMVIHNNTDDEDTLIGASSPAAADVQIHQSQMDEDGVMAMIHVGEIPLLPHADTELKPGGYHVMLIGLVEPLTEGNEIELSLEFATAEPQTLMVPVSGPMGMDAMDQDAMDMDTDDEDEAMEMDED